ncbi:MAG: DUF6259 domain-containing protein [Bacteroidaceae bacterium]|nr:DUF6259 domain-containing protein [Bacteroidaceae bacterium]
MNWTKKTYLLLCGCLLVGSLCSAKPESVTVGDDNICAEVCYDAEGGGAFLKALSCPKNGTEWRIDENQPLFVLGFDGRSVSSTEGWKMILVQKRKKSVRMTFLAAEGSQVELCMESCNGLHISWGECRLLQGEQLNSAALFPIAFRQLPVGSKVFYPYSCGLVYDAATDNVESQAKYPAGFGASMPWFALWDKENRGLYYAAHDKRATMKTLCLSIKDGGSARMEFRYPASAPAAGQPSITPCDIVLRSYDGDWFDAAQIYKTWMKEESFWYANVQMNKHGRRNTPLWMKELCVWARGSVEEISAFRRAMGIPIGFHWYSWHQIPFDNDYPHYIPARAHFAEDVQRLQKEGVYVMPYINGRLWDTRDHGLRDSLFTTLALPSATKQQNGEPNIEEYGSKESDGSSVRLAVMCPSTERWRAKMKEVVTTLLSPVERGGYGVDAVYMDQIAAATPVVCWDTTHRHPSGGGDWWVPAYTELLQDIRSEMPEGKMLTTESNADGYTGVMDGFLTWQFQNDKQVPAFAAVYGGMIQLFGRSYANGQESLRATRMKMMQSLVFGEQLGWMDANILNDKDRFPLLKSLALLRHQFREYFYLGEMVHAPQLLGENPPCRDTWNFYESRNIEMPSVIASAWRRLDKKSGIVILGNCSDETRELQVILPPELSSLSRQGIGRYGTDGRSEQMKRLPSTILIPAGSVVLLCVGRRAL